MVQSKVKKNQKTKTEIKFKIERDQNIGALRELGCELTCDCTG